MSLPAAMASFTKRALIIFSSYDNAAAQTLQARKSSGFATNSSSMSCSAIVSGGKSIFLAFLISLSRASEAYEILLPDDLIVAADFLDAAGRESLSLFLRSCSRLRRFKSL